MESTKEVLGLLKMLQVHILRKRLSLVSRFIQCSYNNLYIWKWILNLFFSKLRLLQAKVSKRHAKLVNFFFTFRSRQSRNHLIKEIKIITLRTIEGARGGEGGRTSLLLSFSSLHFVCYSLFDKTKG